MSRNSNVSYSEAASHLGDDVYQEEIVDEEDKKMPTPPYKEGFLHKRGVFNVSWQRRWFVLKDGELRYYKSMGDTKERGLITVDGCHVTAVGEDKYDKTLCFDISTPSTNRVFALHVDTPTELKEWVEALKAASEWHNKIRMTKFKTSSTSQKLKDMRAQFVIPPEFRKISGVSNKISLWRQPAALKGLNSGMVSGNMITTLSPQDRLESASCSATHDLSGKIAVGSFQGRSSVIQLIGEDMKVIQHFRQSEGCVSMSWVEGSLLVGSAQGNVHYYHCDDTLSTPVDVNMSTVYSHSHLKDPDFSQMHVPPGQWGFSTRIQKVKINPVTKQSFLSLENSMVHLWDFERQDGPIHSENCNSAVFACSWNPHTGNEFILGGLRKHLKLYDMRLLGEEASNGQAVIWKAVDAHADVIRDISWSPLMPNWIASAGDDGCAQIFDMRYGSKPLISLHCTNALYSVNWSNSHSEMLITGGVDRALRLWNLRLAPHYLVDTTQSPRFTSPLVSVDFSHKNALQYYGLSTSGEIASMSMKPDLLESLCQHRQFEGSADPALLKPYAKIESALYRRDLASAYDLISSTSSQFWDQGNHDLVAQLLKLANAGLFHGATDEVPPKSFPKLVQDVSYYIPPNSLRASEPSVNSSQDIQLFKLRIALMRLLDAGKYEDIFALESEIINQVERSTRRSDIAFDSATMQRILTGLLSYDYLRAVNSAYRLAEVYMKLNKFSDFVGLARILFYPTIYHCTDSLWTKEQELNPQTQAQESQLAQKAIVILDRDLRNPKVVLAELELLYEVIDKSQQGLPSSAAPLISLLEPHRKVLPQVLHRLFFHSLLAAKHYDKFFIFASQLAYSLNGYHFSYVLNQMMDDVGYPKLKRFLDEYTMLDRSKPWDTTKLAAAVLTLINIVANCVGLPKLLKQAIPDAMKKITIAMRQALLETKENPSYLAKHGSGTKDASVFATTIIDQINLIEEQKRAVSSYFDSQINTFLEMLQEFK